MDTFAYADDIEFVRVVSEFARFELLRERIDRRSYGVRFREFLAPSDRRVSRTIREYSSYTREMHEEDHARGDNCPTATNGLTKNKRMLRYDCTIN